MLLQLRYGRGLDNRRLKAAGFTYRYTTRETVQAFAEHLRLRSVLKGVQEPYRYEKEVEDFLRWSPSVREREGEFGEQPPRFFPPAPARGSPSSPARARAAERFRPPPRCRLAPLPGGLHLSDLVLRGFLMGRSNS